MHSIRGFEGQKKGIQKGLVMEKKIWCGILEGATYEQNCLYKLSQTIPGNKCCEQCILFENLQLRAKLDEVKLLWRKKIEGPAKKIIRSSHRLKGTVKNITG